MPAVQHLLQRICRMRIVAVSSADQTKTSSLAAHKRQVHVSCSIFDWFYANRADVSIISWLP